MTSAAPRATPNTSPSVRSSPPSAERRTRRPISVGDQHQHDQGDHEDRHEGGRIGPVAMAASICRNCGRASGRPPGRGDPGADPGADAQHLPHQPAHEGEQGGDRDDGEDDEIDPGHALNSPSACGLEPRSGSRSGGGARTPAVLYVRTPPPDLDPLRGSSPQAEGEPCLSTLVSCTCHRFDPGVLSAALRPPPSQDHVPCSASGAIRARDRRICGSAGIRRICGSADFPQVLASGYLKHRNRSVRVFRPVVLRIAPAHVPPHIGPGAPPEPAEVAGHRDRPPGGRQQRQPQGTRPPARRGVSASP